MAAKSMVDTERIKQGIDLRELAGQHTSLHKESAQEMSGPCPRCGGRDRFHVQAGWFFCRQCHPKWGDAIEFVRWLGLAHDFRSACALLDGGRAAAPVAHRKPAPKTRPKVRPAGDWKRRAARLVAQAQERLWEPEGGPAQEYLERRGLTPETWLMFRFGYEPEAPVPGTKGRERAPAVVLPWFAKGGRELVAVRYRFLKDTTVGKISSLAGSTFQGRLYGGHVLDDFVFLATPEEPGAVAQRTLIVCEGELNAASIWQVARYSRLDVVSMGSESQHVPDKFAQWTASYGLVFVWLDRGELARDAALRLPGAGAIESLYGDANDLLRRGLLGGFLARVRKEACGDDRPKKEALLWDLWDAADALLGVDKGTAGVIQDLAEQLGQPVALHEPEPGRWITRR